MPKRMLIVDDETTTLFAYKKLFQKKGVEVETASTLAEAETLFKKHHFEVIITDLRLSGKNSEAGFDILRWVKRSHSDTRVILITAYGNPNIMKEAYNLGASYYFEKPIPIKILREALQQLGID
jgi:two-component system response regulator (stage 0 sporulation protein F)